MHLHNVTTISLQHHCDIAATGCDTSAIQLYPAALPLSFRSDKLAPVSHRQAVYKPSCSVW